MQQFLKQFIGLQVASFHLQCNEKKTNVLTICGKRLSNRTPNDMTISVNGAQLENVQCAKLSGLEIDRELTFE